MRYALAIFDFDGTLGDSYPWFVAAVNGAADRIGFKRMEDDEIPMLRGLGARQIARHLAVPAWKMPLVARHMRRAMTADIHRVRPFSGVPEMLRALCDAGVALAVVTSNTEPNVRRVLGPETSALIRHFGCGGSIFGKAAHFRRVLRASGIAQARAISIGDEIRDADASRLVGIDFGAVSWGYTTPEALRAQSPAALFHSPEDVVRWMAEAPGG